jgi:hypothetical protein
VVDILDDQSIPVPEAGLPPDRRRLNRLELLGAGLFQDFDQGLQNIDLDDEGVASKGALFSGVPAMMSTERRGEETAASCRPASG